MDERLNLPWMRLAETTTSLARRFGATALGVVRDELSADRMLERTMSGLIEIAASRHALDGNSGWVPGTPLELLLVGYSGTRNTGSDVRVEETTRQLRHLFGDEHVSLSVVTANPRLSKGYFAGAKQLHMPKVFPKFLFDTVHRHHGVVACEGSMFKSQFANALTVLMGGALGLASAEGKLAVGYGGEAGKMSPPLEAFVRRHCRDAFVITRNEASAKVVRALGIAGPVGTDTAWTFRAAPPAIGESILRRAGWDGRTPVLALCPIEPFVWPIRPDLVKSVVHAATGVYAPAHYGSIYFHHTGPEVASKQRRYLESIASAVQAFRRDHDVFPIVVGMEQLDRRACEDLAVLLGHEVPIFVSDEHDMYTLVSVLRTCAMVVSSRFHAIVTSMGATVPSAGITMDERIRNILVDRGHPDLVLEVDDPELRDKLYATLHTLRSDREAIAEAIGRNVVTNVATFGAMGRALVDHVRRTHPELPIREELGGAADAWKHLPPLPEELTSLIERYA